MKKQLKAGTILESVIAIVIISVVFSISMMVVEMVSNSYRVALDYRVHLSLIEIANTTKMTQHFSDRSIDGMDFRIEQSLLPYSDYEGVYILSLKAYDVKDKLLMEHKELVIP